MDANVCYRVADRLRKRSYENRPFLCMNFFTPNNILTFHDAQELLQYCKDVAGAESKSTPMEGIGIFIAVISLTCAILMLADLFYGLRNVKLWFHGRFFAINGGILSLIPFAMMLSGDMTGDMPGEMEQVTKLATLAFMCIIMANLMPSLASTDGTTLLQNVSGWSLFVVTMIVYVIVQIRTGVIDNHVSASSSSSDSPSSPYLSILDCAYTYVAMMSVLLIITISSSLAIPISKEILEWKYEAIQKTFSDQQPPQTPQMSLVDKLTQHVSRFWVMAETANPQFVMASSPLSTVSGVICGVVLVMHSILMIESVPHNIAYEFRSSYKNSLLIILVIQSVVLVVGAIAPLFRCFSVFSFKYATKDYLMVYKVENYWTQALYDWKERHTRFLSTRFVFYNLKNMFLSLCIGFQMVVVILCKVIWLFSFVILKSVAYCFTSLSAKFCTPPINQINEDLSRCALRIQDEVEFSEGTLQGISNSVNSFIAEQKEDDDLLELLNRSTSFNGVWLFDSDDDEVVPLQFCAELVMSWSLTIVNLTSIAISLPRIPRDEVQRLIRSVREGLSHTHFVEAILNPSSEYVNAQKAAISLWDEVENNHMWLNNSLSNDAFQEKTAIMILEWFSNKAKEIFAQISKCGIMVQGRIPKEIIASDSMYRIAETILFRDQTRIRIEQTRIEEERTRIEEGTSREGTSRGRTRRERSRTDRTNITNIEAINIEPINIEQLFELLRARIADILSACFTNIPQGIKMKCEESIIEKRVSSVRDAAKTLGKTKRILERLDGLNLPPIDADKIVYIKEWHLHYRPAIP